MMRKNVCTFFNVILPLFGRITCCILFLLFSKFYSQITIQSGAVVSGKEFILEDINPNFDQAGDAIGFTTVLKENITSVNVKKAKSNPSKRNKLSLNKTIVLKSKEVKVTNTNALKHKSPVFHYKTKNATEFFVSDNLSSVAVTTVNNQNLIAFRIICNSANLISKFESRQKHNFKYHYIILDLYQVGYFTRPPPLFL